MVCSECGYVLTPFEAKCPRCAVKGASRQPRAGGASSADSNPSVPGTAGISARLRQADAEEVRKAASSDPSATSIIPDPKAPGVVVPHRPAVVVTPSVAALSPTGFPSIGCPHCGNTNIEKVSVIVRSGTWNQQSSWTEQTKIDTQTTSAGFGVLWGQRHSSPMTTVSGGHTSGKGETYGSGSASGATDLARLLAPPTAPASPLRKSISETTWKWLLGIPAVTFIWQGMAIFSHPLDLLLAVGCLAILPLTWFSNKEQYKTELIDYDIAVKNWQNRYMIWETLYYCRQCDCALSPQTGKTVHSTEISSLF